VSSVPILNDLGACGLGSPSYLARRGHRIEHARHDLFSPPATEVVSDFGFEQFRVRQDDTQLIIQSMKQERKIRRCQRGINRCAVRPRRLIHAWCPAVLSFPDSKRVDIPGSRHSVSAKIRIEPPAVRTYLTFRAAIQL